MKKIVAFTLSLILLFQLFVIPSEADTGETLKRQFHLKPQAGDERKAQVTFQFEMYEDMEQILLDQITFNKEIIPPSAVSYNPSTRMLSVTIKGEKVKTDSKVVVGYSSSSGRLFQSNLYNAVCRYSDGERWQINNVDQSTLRFQTSIITNGYQKAPSDPPTKSMKELLAFTKRTLDRNTTYFFEDNQNNSLTPDSSKLIPVDRNLIDPNSLEVTRSQAQPIKMYDNTNPYLVFLGEEGEKYDPKNPIIGVKTSMPHSGNIEKFFSEFYDRPLPPGPGITMTGHAGCWSLNASYEYYITAKTLPSEEYKYIGSIEVPYIKSDDPTMTGTLTADPVRTKFNNEDVKVKVTLDAEVRNLHDPRVIDYFMIYLRTEDGTISADPIKIIGTGQTKISGTHEFTIPKSVMTSKDEHVQVYVGRARAFYKPSEIYKGHIETQLLYANSTVYKEEPINTPPPPQQKAPVAIIKGDNQVKLGDYTSFNGYDSYDTDGTIEQYKWEIPNAKGEFPKDWDAAAADVLVWYDKLGTQKLSLSVKDNDNLQGKTQHYITVIEPTVEAAIGITGTLKENRKVTIKNDSDSPTFYPIIKEKIKWTVVSEYGDQDNQIRYEGTLNGKDSFDILFKKAGDYRVTLEVENTAGYKSTATRVFTIIPDEPPHVDFSFQEKEYRDPNNQNKATFTLYDESYSYDGDSIVERKWYVIFDANNDGVFNEPKVLFDQGNNKVVKYETKSVGKYAFYLEVQEEFGQPTIEKLVTASDRKKANTWE